MRDALNATGRPTYYAMCNWGCEAPWLWASTVANSWRTTFDIKASWNSVVKNSNLNSDTWPYAAPGGFNDPDMLEVGVAQLTLAQQRTHFSVWAMMKAPLILGCDVRTVASDTVTILTNRKVLATNQDPLGQQAWRVGSGSLDIWVAPLTGGRAAVLVVGRGRLLMHKTTRVSVINDFPSSLSR